MIILGQWKVVLFSSVVGGAGSVWSGTDWYLVVPYQNNLVLLGI